MEMLTTAVALNLNKAPIVLQEARAPDGIVSAVMGGGNARHAVEGMLHRHLLSTSMAAYPVNADGVPFDMSHIYAGGNLAADMYCNVAVETTGPHVCRAAVQRDAAPRPGRTAPLNAAGRLVCYVKWLGASWWQLPVANPSPLHHKPEQAGADDGGDHAINLVTDQASLLAAPRGHPPCSVHVHGHRSRRHRDPRGL